MNFIETLQSDWDAFFKDWLRPATDLLLPTLAFLVFLLVLARLSTRLVVPPDGAPPDTTPAFLEFTANGAGGRCGWQGS